MIRVFWDTNLFIYMFEDYGPLTKQVRELLSRLEERRARIVTSTMTLGEILIGPLRKGRQDLATEYRAVLASEAITLVPFNEECAWLYAQIRLDKSIQRADAIQLACAAHAKCDLFITNDERLSRKIIPGIQFIVPLEKAVL
jgi:predicted nucleic acid-binding protein